MIALGTLLAGALLVLASADGCNTERAPQSDSGTLDALLFLLVLIGVVAQHKRKQDDDF